MALPRRLSIPQSVTANLAPFANKSLNAARARIAQPEIKSAVLMIGEAFSLTTAFPPPWTIEEHNNACLS